MIGLILVTHGKLASEFLVALEHVVGPQKNVATIKTVDTGKGVIILSDLFGGTPSNLAISLLDSGRVEVIAGVNLPMLIRLDSARKNLDVKEAVAAAREAGRKYISVASEVLEASR